MEKWNQPNDEKANRKEEERDRQPVERLLCFRVLRVTDRLAIPCREQERSVAVTAGPGSGKTELLAQRADFLLRTNICPYPRRILAISFKTDAAANLGARVRERVPPDLASRLDSQTFHSFALRLIRRFVRS